MLIDCDTCTARGAGCADCVVTVLLGAPPGRAAGPVVVPLRGPGSRPPATAADGPRPGVLVELDEVERRAVRALAEGGLVPPLRHQDDAHGSAHGSSHQGGARPGRRTA